MPQYSPPENQLQTCGSPAPAAEAWAAARAECGYSECSDDSADMEEGRDEALDSGGSPNMEAEAAEGEAARLSSDVSDFSWAHCAQPGAEQAAAECWVWTVSWQVEQ